MTQGIEHGTTDLTIRKALQKNFLGLPRAATWTGLLSGLLIVFISTTGPIAILFQAAAAGKLTTSQTNSWLFAVFLGSGIFGLLLTLRFGMPIIGSWAATTTALLVTGLVQHSYADVIGAYFVASIILIAIGISGLFGKIMALIPHPVIMAMLAGILFNFGTKIFTATKINPFLGISMIIIFFIGRRLKLRATIFFALIAGVLVAIVQNKITNPHVAFSVVKPEWTTPKFSFGIILTLVIPIVLMVMTTQNATGISLLRAAKFTPPINQIVGLGGVLSLLGSGFGGAGVNISAMTAVIAMSPDADPNPKTRYFAGVATALTYIAAAVFAGIFSTLFGSFPMELTAVLAGLALLPVIIASVSEAVEVPDYREAAMVTFLITVSGVTGWGVGAPFWGLAAGIALHRFNPLKK